MGREEEHMTTDYIRQVNLKEKLTEAYRSVERAISNIDDANTLLHEDKHEELQNRSFVNFNAKYFNREVSPFQVFTESFK